MGAVTLFLNFLLHKYTSYQIFIKSTKDDELMSVNPVLPCEEGGPSHGFLFIDHHLNFSIIVELLLVHFNKQ